MRAEAIAEHRGNRELVFRVARRLLSANEFHGRKWWAKKKERDSWEAALRMALRFDPALFEAPGRVRLDVARYVPSARNFIKDSDNLMFATKPLRDSLKALGLIREDSMKWLETSLPEQHISPDGKDWTVVRLRALRG